MASIRHLLLEPLENIYMHKRMKHYEFTVNAFMQGRFRYEPCVIPFSRHELSLNEEKQGME